MGLHQRDIATLVGRVIIGIDMDEGDVELHMDNGDEYIITGPSDSDNVGDIEGDMTDLCDTPITSAQYSHGGRRLLLETDAGVVTLNVSEDASFYRAL